MTVVLHQLGLSHYCEKVRWALEHKQIPHTKKTWLVGLHREPVKKISGKSQTPVITSGDQVISNSADIITWLDQEYPDRPLTPAGAEAQQALDWESYVDDKVGGHVRRICYHTLIRHKDVVLPLFTQGGPWYGRVVMPLMYSKLQSLMISYMQLDDENTLASIDALDREVDKINAHLDGREFMVGNSFSRADLAVAALLAPLVQPDGYGLVWPETLPEPLAGTVTKFQPRLRWVQQIYQNYRQ